MDSIRIRITYGSQFGIMVQGMSRNWKTVNSNVILGTKPTGEFGASYPCSALNRKHSEKCCQKTCMNLSKQSIGINTELKAYKKEDNSTLTHRLRKS